MFLFDSSKQLLNARDVHQSANRIYADLDGRLLHDAGELSDCDLRPLVPAVRFYLD